MQIILKAGANEICNHAQFIGQFVGSEDSVFDAVEVMVSYISCLKI